MVKKRDRSQEKTPAGRWAAVGYRDIDSSAALTPDNIAAALTYRQRVAVFKMADGKWFHWDFSEPDLLAELRERRIIEWGIGKVRLNELGIKVSKLLEKAT